MKTFPIGGTTLKQAYSQLAQKGEWGSTHDQTGIEKLKICQQNNKIYGLTFSVKVTINMPTWSGYTNAGPNSRKEWDRMWTNLKTHEDGHVDILRQHFTEALAKSMIGKTVSQAKALLDAARKMVNEAYKIYDVATDHGVKQGVTLDTSITD